MGLSDFTHYLNQTASSIARDLVIRVATDRTFATNLANAIKYAIDDPPVPIKTDWAWDARGGQAESSFGYGKGRASFPGKPDKFTENDIRGGLLFNIEWNPTIISQMPPIDTEEYETWKARGGSISLSNIIVDVDVEVSLYYKALGGDAKTFGFQKLGVVSITLDATEEKPVVEQNSSLNTLKNNLSKLIDQIIQNPPAIMQSSAYQKRTKQQQQTQQIIKQQQQTQQEILEGEKDFYSDLDKFVEFAFNEAEADEALGGESRIVFGPKDIQKLMLHTHKSRNEIMQHMYENGLEYDSSRRESLASNITSIAIKLVSYS